MVLLHQSAHRRHRRRCTFLLLPPTRRRCSSSTHLVEKASPHRPHRRRPRHGRNHLLRLGSSVRRQHSSLVERHRHWSPRRLRPPRLCTRRLGNLPRRLRHDATPPVPPTLSLGHSPLLILLHGLLHRPPLLSPHLFSVHPWRLAHQIRCQQSASSPGGRRVRARGRRCGHEDRPGPTGHGGRVGARYHCDRPHLHA